MHISFGSPPPSVDDIQKQSYLESFDCKKEMDKINKNSQLKSQYRK